MCKGVKLSRLSNEKEHFVWYPYDYISVLLFALFDKLIDLSSNSLRSYKTTWL